MKAYLSCRCSRLAKTGLVEVLRLAHTKILLPCFGIFPPCSTKYSVVLIKIRYTKSIDHYYSKQALC